MANEFYTLTSLGTLVGATGATVAVTNALKAAFNLSPKWLGLLIAEIICVGILIAVGTAHASDWFVAVLNGCLVYVTAAGATSAGNAAVGGSSGITPNAAARSANVKIEGATPDVATKRRFWSPWF